MYHDCDPWELSYHSKFVQLRMKLQSENRNLSSDVNNIRDQLEEEQDGRSALQRQLSKASNEAQQWRAKFETEGAARTDELEDAR